MFCPKCKGEFIEGITDCSDCGIPLVKELPESPLQPKNIEEPPYHPSDYLNNITEWNKHMYNPGHWVGGNIPPHINVLRKAGNLPIGIVALVLGIGLVFFVSLNIAEADLHNPDELVGLIPSSGVAGFFGAVLVWAGIQRIKNAKK